MEVGVHLLLVGAGFGLAIVASDRAVAYTRALAAALGVPSFLVGAVLVSLGTDLPEIANSIVAHLSDEGDVNVGDSVGSALTQSTLVLGLLPLVLARIAIDRRAVSVVAGLTVAALVLAAGLTADGRLARLDGALMVAAWALATFFVLRVRATPMLDEPPRVRVSGRFAQSGIVLGALALVGLGAAVGVRSLVRLAELVGVPEFVLAFFGASFGTSAPELAVDVTSILRGAPQIALGDALGSSLVDATLSLGIGPLVAPADVTARLAVAGSLYSAAAIGVAGALLVARGRHDRASMVVLLALYALAYVVVIGAQ